MSAPIQVTDITLVSGALSAPLWVNQLETTLHWYVMAAGAILLTLRIIKVALEMRKK